METRIGSQIDPILKDACAKLLRGEEVPGEAHNAIRTLMGDQAKFAHLLEESKMDPDLFICLMKFVREGLIDRTYLGEDFRLGSYRSKIMEMLEAMIPFLGLGTESRDMANMYIGCFGSLLGLFLRFEGDGLEVQNLLNFIWQKSERQLEETVYTIAKIIESSLHELSRTREQASQILASRLIFEHFIEHQSEAICTLLSHFLTLFANNFQQISGRDRQICQSITCILLTALDNYFQVTGRGEHLLEEPRRHHQPLLLMQWELPRMREWLKILFHFLNNVTGTFCHEKIHSKSAVDTLVCRLIGMVRHIYYVLVPGEKKNKNAIQTKRGELCEEVAFGAEQAIINQLILPYLRKTSWILHHASHKAIQSPHDLINFINDRAQVLILKIMLHHSRIIRHLMYLDEQTASDHPHKSTPHSLGLIDYCEYILRTFPPNFDSHSECPHFLAFKLFCQSRDQQKAHSHKVESQIMDHYNSKHRFLFIQLVMKRMLEPREQQGQTWVPLDGQEGNHWNEMIDSIDNYFLELSMYGPNFFQDQADGDSSDSYVVEEIDSDQDGNSEMDLFQEITLAADGETDSSKNGTSDYLMFKELIESASRMEHAHRIQGLPSLIYFFSALNATLISGRPVEARSKTYFSVYQYLIKISNGIRNHSRCQRQLLTVYLVEVLLKECIPDSYINDGSDSMTMTVFFVDNRFTSMEGLVEELTENLRTCLSTSVNPENTPHSELVNNVDSCLYVFDVLTGLAEKFSKKAEKIEAEGKGSFYTYEIDECQNVINKIFDCLLNYQISTHPECTLRLYRIQGILVNQFTACTLYEIVDQLKGRTKNPHLQHYSQCDQKQQRNRVYSFLAGMTGIMGSLTKQTLMRSWLQICMMELSCLFESRRLQVDIDSYEYLVQLAKEMTDPRIYFLPHDNEVPSVYNFYGSIIPLFAKEYLECPMQHDQMNQVYMHLAKLPVVGQLLPLPQVPEGPGFAGFPSNSLLDEYFDSLHRLESVESIYRFTHLKVEYVIRFLEVLIEKDVQLSEQDLEASLKDWQNALQDANDDQKLQVVCLARIIASGKPSESIKSTINNEACSPELDLLHMAKCQY